MENKLNDLMKIYDDIYNECDLYDYNCNKCPYNKLCDLLGELIARMNENGDDEE